MTSDNRQRLLRKPTEAYYEPLEFALAKTQFYFHNAYKIYPLRYGNNNLMTFRDNSSKIFCKVMPKTDPSIKFKPWEKHYMHISIATEHIRDITVQKILKKVLSKCPPEFGFFSPDAYAVLGVRGTSLPLLHRQCLPRAGVQNRQTYSCILPTQHPRVESPNQ